MNKNILKEKIMKDTNELKERLVLTNKFNDLSVFVGNYDTYKELGTIAACVTQEDRPFIFLADSTILTKFRLTKKEIKAILYHELAHYRLGHTDIDRMIDTDITLELYRQQELDADAQAVELAVQDGLSRRDISITLATSLAKSGTYIMEEALTKGMLPQQECMEFLQERVNALLSKEDRDLGNRGLKRFQKQSMKRLTMIAVSKGHSSVDDMIDNMQAVPDNNIEIDQDILDSIDSLLDEIWNS